MKKLILGAALAALTVTSFAALTQDPARICVTSIPGVGYTGTLHIITSTGEPIATTRNITVGETRCLKVPRLREGTVWFAVDTASLIYRMYSVNCDHGYVYHASTSHGEAWYKWWGIANNPQCGRAG